MQIKKLTAASIMPVVADAMFNKKSKVKNKKIHFNIKHGSLDAGTHAYSIGISKKIAMPKDINDILELNNDDYILKPIYKNEMHIQDGIGNYLYYIGTDRVEDHKKDIILLWEIPNKFYTDVNYGVKGDSRLLGTGSICRTRGSVDYMSPSPVLEIYGDCSLCWSAKDSNGKKLEQNITFINGVWNIGMVASIDDPIGADSEEHN